MPNEHELDALMESLILIIDYDQNQEHPAPLVDHRDDMTPVAALWDCCDSWAGGAWSEGNVHGHLREVRHHLTRIAEET